MLFLTGSKSLWGPPLLLQHIFAENKPFMDLLLVSRENAHYQISGGKISILKLKSSNNLELCNSGDKL